MPIIAIITIFGGPGFCNYCISIIFAYSEVPDFAIIAIIGISRPGFEAKSGIT